MDWLYFWMAISGGLVLVFGFAEGWFRHWLSISEPLLALLAGIAVGPYGWGFLTESSPIYSTHILEELAGVSVGLGVAGVAMRLPKDYPCGQFLDLMWLLGPVLLMMGLTAALLVLRLPSVALLPALALGAALAPTDPVLAGATVTGLLATKRIPANVRHILSGESGANDGAALAIVVLPALLIQHPWMSALSEWCWVVTIEIVLFSSIAAVLGWILGRIECSVEKSD